MNIYLNDKHLFWTRIMLNVDFACWSALVSHIDSCSDAY